MGKENRLQVKRKKSEGDFWELILTLMLSVFGLVMVLSASYYYDLNKYGKPFYSFTRESIFFLLGWAAFVFFAFFFDYHFLRPFSFLALFVGFALLGLIFTPLGVTINNATRWLDFKVITIMPGEVIKTCLILFLAAYLSGDPSRTNSFFNGILPIAMIGGAAFFMIYKQPNLSTAGTVLMLILLIWFIAGLKWSYILIAVGLLAAGFIFIILNSGGEYMLERVRTAIDPWADPLGSGYQVIQSLLALGSGGVKGLGIGNSVQKTLYLPEPQNDFILAIIGEEFGFVGVLLLMIVYMALTWRCFKAAVRSRDLYGLLLASGVGLHLGIQTVLNIAIVSASFFPTGVALPFITMGGNSLMLFLAEMGIVYNVSKNPDGFFLEEVQKTQSSEDAGE